MKKPGSRWMMVAVTMPDPKDIDRGMEIATTFEDRHGDHPPMYFARYTEDNTIRITVFTKKTDAELKKFCRRLGAVKVKVHDRGAGSWEHCHAYQAAKHLFGKEPKCMMDVIHWMHNMCNFNYLQETTNYAESSALFLTHLVKRPGEKEEKSVS